MIVMGCFALEKEEDFSGLLSKKWEFSQELIGKPANKKSSINFEME